MSAIRIRIDGREIKAHEGEKILWVALSNGIYIPNLCAIKEESEPSAACRLCFVEIEGRSEPVTACTEPVRDGMVINTRGEKATRLARTAAELLIAAHNADCPRCPKSGSCELQKIARHLRIGLKPRRLRKMVRDLPRDESLPTLLYDPNKCVLCGRCVWVCHEKLGIAAIGFTRRGFRRIVSTFADRPLAQSRCNGCAECAEVCPVGSLIKREALR